MNETTKKEKVLDKTSMTFKELKEALINNRTLKDEYRQVAIVLIRNIFSERQSKDEPSTETET